MPRKRKTRSRKPTEKSLINVNATLRKLQSQLTDPRVYQWLFTGARGVRERLLKIDYEVLRNIVDKIPLVNGIINTRIDQINPFCRFTMEDGEKGFKFIVADRSGKEKLDEGEVYQLAEFIEQTGFQYDPEREDDFMDYVQMIVRDTMIIDQIATEIQFNRAGEAVSFWSLDGATIRRVMEESQFKRGVRFVQEIEQKIYNEYTADQLVFDYKNKRADIRYRGYGYSNIEMCVDMITTLLFGYNYLRDQLVRDRIPKGFISVMGDASKPQMDAIRNYEHSHTSVRQGGGRDRFQAYRAQQPRHGIPQDDDVPVFNSGRCVLNRPGGDGDKDRRLYRAYRGKRRSEASDVEGQGSQIASCLRGTAHKQGASQGHHQVQAEIRRV